jgi:TolA-binding protein
VSGAPSSSSTASTDARVAQLEQQLSEAQTEIARWQTVNNQLMSMVYDADNDAGDDDDDDDDDDGDDDMPAD